MPSSDPFHPGPNPSPGSPEVQGPAHRRPVTLTDLTRQLVWPMLLRAPRFAFLPLPLASGILVAWLAGLIDGLWPRALGLPADWSGVLSEPLKEYQRSGQDLLGLVAGPSTPPSAPALGSALLSLFLRSPWRLASEYWPSIILVGLVIALAAWAILVSSRSTALAVGYRRADANSPGRPLAIALRRTRSILGAWLAPIGMIWALGAAAAIIGWLLGRPIVNVVAALILPLAFLAALAAFIIAFFWLFMAPLVAGASATEDADGFDVLQRAYAYALAAPLRLAIYLATSLAVLFVTLAIIRALFSGIDLLFLWSTGGDLSSATPLAPWLAAAPSPQPSGYEAASAITRFWARAMALLISGYTISHLGAASTLLYLAMRRIVDGQDERDIWQPGLVSGTLVDAAPLEASPAATSNATATSTGTPSAAAPSPLASANSPIDAPSPTTPQAL